MTKPVPLPLLTPTETARYARHLILDDVGMTGQRTFKAASVLCVGAGGLGSPLLTYLAAAGVGRIGIVDFDIVDESNLQRQIIHGTSDLGQPKVESAARRIQELNPHCTIDLHPVPLSSDNALKILKDYDVIVDGTDNFPTRYLINDACAILGKPWVYGSIYKFEGQASVFNHAGGPNYRDLYPEPPPPGSTPSCAEGGVLGVLPGIIGCIQATETLKILLGKGDTLSGRLLLYDALSMRFHELKLRKDPTRTPPTSLIDYQDFCGVPPTSGDATERFERLKVSEIQAKLDAGWRPFVIDVRTPAEAQIVSLDFVDRLIPHDAIESTLSTLPKNRDILVHCKLGGRSAKAARSLAAAGFERVTSMEGGIIAWANEIDPKLIVY